MVVPCDGLGEVVECGGESATGLGRGVPLQDVRQRQRTRHHLKERDTMKGQSARKRLSRLVDVRYARLSNDLS